MRMYYDLITSLPVLSSIGDFAPLSLVQFKNRCIDFEKVFEIIDSIILEPLSWDANLWSSYFKNLYKLGDVSGCGFLTQWVGFEVALRNNLVMDRAAALGMDPHLHVVAGELSVPCDETRDAVSRWGLASDPLAGQKILDKARWDWIEQNNKWFSFKIDELAAYTCCLILLHRWDGIRARGALEREANVS